MASHEVVDEQVDGRAGIALLSHEHELRVAFAPDVGLVGYSLTHRGEELLGQRGGLTAYRERGSSFGIPLLHPWANRLAGREYTANRRPVRLDPERSPVRLDPSGLPIHGLLAANPDWSIVGRTPGDGRAAVAARFDFAAHEDLLAAFPFPHELHVQLELVGDTLSVVTIVLPTGDVAVPLAFGWHPYLHLPGAARADWRVELPVRTRAVLDDRGLPTDVEEAVNIAPGPLGERDFDDLYPRLEDPAVFAVEGGGRRLELELGQGYPIAQVYGPADAEFICFEPMTAPTNALVTGERLGSVAPGDSFHAEWRLRVRG
jgi:aldose 1-epimerase